jgi:predicted ester cyclase
MSPDELKQLTDRFIEAWNACDGNKLDEILTADFAYHSFTYGDLDREGYKKYMIGVHAAYPDAYITLEDLLSAEENHGVWRMTFHGTDKGGSVILGTPPTGRSVAMRIMSIVRVTGNLFAEAWAAEDALGLMKQLKG